MPVDDPSQLTDFGARLQRAHAAGETAADLRRVVTTYQSSAEHVKQLEGLPFDVVKGLTWVAAQRTERIGDLDLPGILQALYGDLPAKLVASPAFEATRIRLSDTVVAEALHASWERPLDTLIAARKFLLLVERVAAGPALAAGTTLGAALAGAALTLPDFARWPAPPPAPAAPPPPPPASDEDQPREHLRALETAHRELSRKLLDEDAMTVRERRPSAETAHPTSPVGPARPAGAVAAPLATSRGARIVMKPEAIAALSDTSRQALARAGIDLRRMEPSAAVARLEEELHAVAERLASGQQADTVLVLGGVMLDTRIARASLLGSRPWLAELVAGSRRFESGVGDLLLVTQTLKAYELAEFAHVENVLAGESREREHRRLNLREEVEVVEEERETEKERNLQSTERNEMQAEAQETVKSQFSLEAGLQVSGSYGPAVSFSASLKTGFQTSAEETQRNAVSYSREVTAKTSERVRERVRQETRRRLLEQVEEINRHSIVNAPATNGHVRGIYRWLNKVYDAQIVNYGQRMMLEFVVPEPAAYLIYALIENPPKDSELVKPVAPSYRGAPLNPSHLTRATYLDWVAKYQVRNVPPPPPELQEVVMFDSQDYVQGGSTFGRSTKIAIPAGYHTYAATVMSDYTHDVNSAFSVQVGGNHFDCPSWGHNKIVGHRSGELGVAYIACATSFALAIEVHCRLSAEGLARWQQQVYDAIMEAYLQQQQDYEERLAALAIQRGVTVLGRNPLENRRIEREELKKLVLMMLTGDDELARDSMQPGVEPRIDLHRAAVNGSRIRFFENAFEWNNLLYVLYPYFWGGKARWISALHFTDPDLDFAAFLKAGAARVQVPVRPGFERAVAHFCQFGSVWEGNDPPLRDDDLYVPIVDEITGNLGKLDAGVPYPAGAAPWELRLPTSLVLVQDVPEIPGIVDMLTGAKVTIT